MPEKRKGGGEFLRLRGDQMRHRIDIEELAPADLGGVQYERTVVYRSVDMDEFSSGLLAAIQLKEQLDEVGLRSSYAQLLTQFAQGRFQVFLASVDMAAA